MKLHTITSSGFPLWDGAPVYIVERNVGVGNRYLLVRHALLGVTTLEVPERVKPAPIGLSLVLEPLLDAYDKSKTAAEAYEAIENDVGCLRKHHHWSHQLNGKPG